jgi:glucose/mannose-6-phosphate isomerase
MTLDDIKTLDPSGMFERIRSFPTQVREAVTIGTTVPLPPRRRPAENIVLCGLGGSAIAGDLLKSYLAGDLSIPFLVNRHYTLPACVGPSTLVILSSYSGNTEETNAAHREALRRKARLLCITSGGTTAALAARHHTPMITIPGGSPPRAALGYSFFPLLLALSRMGYIRNRQRDIRETIALLEEKSALYAVPETSANPALQLAELLQGRITVLYSSTEHIDAVNTRWRGQIAENAKALCFGHVLPEMNHNELVGWHALHQQMKEMVVVFLRDRGDHRRVQIRMDISRQILREYTSHVTEVWSEGRSLLTRMFSLLYMGDWVSFYLAMLHRVDPTPVRVIDHLKQELAKV